MQWLVNANGRKQDTKLYYYVKLTGHK